MEVKQTQQALLDSYRTRLEKGAESRQTADHTVSAKVETPGNSPDRVNVSDEARLRGLALSSVMQAPDLRSGRIAVLKEQLAAGTYQTDSFKTASALLELEQGLGGTLKD